MSATRKRMGGCAGRAAAWAPILVALVLYAAPARADGRLEKVTGHLGVGYAKLFIDQPPGGSFSLNAGLDYPLAPTWRAGATMGFELFGGRTVQRGSLFANVDYSLLEMLALAHWEPPHLWPLRRVSFGPGLFSARADLSTSGGGASFSDLAVQQAAPGAALDLSVIQRRDSPVRIGFEVGVRTVFLDHDTWTVAGARLAFYY